MTTQDRHEIEKFKPYIQHTAKCTIAMCYRPSGYAQWRNGDERACDCGLSALLAEVPPPPESIQVNMKCTDSLHFFARDSARCCCGAQTITLGTL